MLFKKKFILQNREYHLYLSWEISKRQSILFIFIPCPTTTPHYHTLPSCPTTTPHPHAPPQPLLREHYTLPLQDLFIQTPFQLELEDSTTMQLLHETCSLSSFLYLSAHCQYSYLCNSHSPSVHTTLVLSTSRWTLDRSHIYVTNTVPIFVIGLHI